MTILRTLALLTSLALACVSHAALTPQQLADLIQSEDLSLDLTPQLDSFAASLLASGPLPAPPHTTGLASLGSPGSEQINPWLGKTDWPLAPTKTDPWAALHPHIANWSDARFGIKSATLARGDRPAFEMLTSFEGRGTTAGKQPFGAKATQTIIWHHYPERGWLLHTWHQHTFELTVAPQPLFTESLALALPDRTALTKAQRSIKDEMVAHTVSTGDTRIPESAKHLLPYVDPESGHSFPSCQVVDIDSDGWDDLFLTSRWGHTQLLRNQTDGTFEEVSEKWNLRRPYLVNTALFFDADNDGDPDALLGGAMVPAEFLINDGSSFKNVTATHTDLGDQHFVTGISASDVNRDGFLDLYLATYAPAGTRKVNWAEDFLDATEQALYQQYRADDHRWLNHRGSANVLLMNRGGGKLERVPYDKLLSQWHFSHTSAWADYDDDGDDDLYICNDFAPDALLRNDTPAGAADPVFTDVTRDVISGGALGFGMGASWGDFDRDGDLDLYVSNMYSKAGARIIAKVGEVDPRTRAAAAGNFLFENHDGKLTNRSKALGTDRAGWSYGGQWCDFDNDGLLDLYVPAGYYTAPPQVASNVDT